VNEYHLSVLAELDLADIADYTVHIWGKKQAHLYLDNLVECFDRIAKMPGLGRDCHPVHPGFRRIEQGKHVIFYMPDERGVFISRILHQSMLPTRHELVGGD
jgi:toxin ParE1/3/4